MPIITLTTDFGTRDHYAAAMRGVLLSLAPKSAICDITHDIEPHNVLHGAFVLCNVWPWFPEGTIHIAVVDPGVGGERRMLLARYESRYVLAPDNGLITLLHRTMRVEEMRVIENRRYFLPGLSTTFHGRDILAPVAAHLSTGIRPREFGRTTDHVEILPIAYKCDSVARRITGQVLYVDRFGTLITNIHQRDLAAIPIRETVVEVYVGEQSIGPIRSYYSQVPAGEPIALIGSTEYLEIAVNMGRAVDRFGSANGTVIEVR